MKRSKTIQKTALVLGFITAIHMGTIQGQDTLTSIVPLAIEQQPPAKSYDQFRLSLNGGFSYRISKVHDDFHGEIRDYVQELKSGTGFSAEGLYFFRERIGLGLKYAIHRSSNSANLRLPNSSGYDSALISDDISITFFGPVMGTRFYNKTGKNALIIQYGMGYVGYNNHSRIPDRLKITGGTFGTCTDFGYEMQIYQGVSLGLQISYFTGNLTRLKYSDGVHTETKDLEIEEYEGVSRFEVLAGLRFSW